MNAVGKNLKQLRQREKLTQDALAERLHVTRQAVSSWETGKTQPDIETLTALAEALNADIRELIYGPGRMERPYTRFQRRYIICAAVCVLILLAWAVMEWTLRPYLWRRRAEMFEIYPYMFYTFLVPPMACITAGVLLPAAASLWRDIRLGAPKLRMCLLVLGLLALIPQLLVALTHCKKRNKAEIYLCKSCAATVLWKSSEMLGDPRQAVKGKHKGKLCSIPHSIHRPGVRPNRPGRYQILHE